MTPPLFCGVVANEKWAIGSPSTPVVNFTICALNTFYASELLRTINLIYIYIYIYSTVYRQKSQDWLPIDHLYFLRSNDIICALCLPAKCYISPWSFCLESDYCIFTQYLSRGYLLEKHNNKQTTTTKNKKEQITKNFNANIYNGCCWKVFGLTNKRTTAGHNVNTFPCITACISTHCSLLSVSASK